jgi:hypothetical protein
MYDGSTHSTIAPDPRDETFRNILQRAADTISSRMRAYDPVTDPLKRSHLRLLFDIVTIEVDRVSAGLGYNFAGLGPPIRAVCAWGEPPDSELTSVLREAESYYQSDYCLVTKRKGSR